MQPATDMRGQSPRQIAGCDAGLRTMGRTGAGMGGQQGRVGRLDEIRGDDVARTDQPEQPTRHQSHLTRVTVPHQPTQRIRRDRAESGAKDCPVAPGSGLRGGRLRAWRGLLPHCGHVGVPQVTCHPARRGAVAVHEPSGHLGKGGHRLFRRDRAAPFGPVGPQNQLPVPRQFKPEIGRCRAQHRMCPGIQRKAHLSRQFRQRRKRRAKRQIQPVCQVAGAVIRMHHDVAPGLGRGIGVQQPRSHQALQGAFVSGLGQPADLDIRARGQVQRAVAQILGQIAQNGDLRRIKLTAKRAHPQDQPVTRHHGPVGTGAPAFDDRAAHAAPSATVARIELRRVCHRPARIRA